MITKIRFLYFGFISSLIFCTGCGSKEISIPNLTDQQLIDRSKNLTIQIILGSTRLGRTSPKIAAYFKKLAEKKGVAVEIVDINNYNLPILYEEEAPAKRTQIANANIMKWSQKISKGDAFIILVPEYNAGYPGVLKNALDLLYKEWNNKPIAIIGYSGGPSGAASAITQLQQIVSNGLSMKPIKTTIKIPSAWKAFDNQGNLIDKKIEAQFYAMLSELITAAAEPE